MIPTLLGILPRGLWIASGTQTGAELQFVGNRGFDTYLPVCVAYEERHVFQTLTVHVVHGIATAAADADYLDNTIFCQAFQRKSN